MIWSVTPIPRMFPTFRSLLVTSISWLLGVRSPLGWLCIRMMDAALHKTTTKRGDGPRVFKTVSNYMAKLYGDKKLSFEETIRKFRIVQTDGNRQLAKLVDPYRRKTILSVEYRVRSRRGVQFRRWATSQSQKHPCQCDAILPIDSRPLPIADEKTRGLSPRFIRMRSTPAWTASTTCRCSASATATRTSRKA